MKHRGKAVALAPGNGCDAFSMPEIPCRVHPRTSNVGVCSFCLNDRLLNLVCSECGEQRLSSCSCSDDLSSNRNSSCAYDVGSVGRISFLLENEKQGMTSQSVGQGPQKTLVEADKLEDEVVLRRSSSSCVETRRSGIWNLGKLFRRKKKTEKSSGDDPGQSELWVLDGMPVSRSRSLCNFRGSDNWNFTGGRASSANGNLGVTDPNRKSCYSEVEMRRSGFSETETRKSCFSEADARKSGGIEGVSEAGNLDGTRLNRRVFSLKESDYFGGMDERNFINLRFFSASESKLEDCGGMMKGDCSKPGKGHVREGVMLRSGSCRDTARDNNCGMKKKGGSRSFMGLRWIFRHHHNHQLGPQQKQQLRNTIVMSENGKR